MWHSLCAVNQNGCAKFVCFINDVFDRIDVWVDGGVRRGTDVVKALCLGAKGVGIGRPPLFGLGAGGTKGVERVLEILKAETETCMRLLGVTKVEDLGPQYVSFLFMLTAMSFACLLC